MPIITVRQREIIEKLKIKGWSLHRGDICYLVELWTVIPVSIRVVRSLLKKELIIYKEFEDGEVEYELTEKGRAL